MIFQRIFRRGKILLDRIVSPPKKNKERNVLSHFLVRLMAILSFSPFRETTGVEPKNIYMHVCLSLKWLYPNNSFFVVFWFCGTFVSWQSRLKAVQINFIFSSATNSKFQRMVYLPTLFTIKIHQMKANIHWVSEIGTKIVRVCSSWGQ